MKTSLAMTAALVAAFAVVSPAVDGAEEAPTLLVLPFPGLDDVSPEVPEGAVTAQMMEFCLARGESAVPVDRRNLDALLAEHSLSLSGLTDDPVMVRTGRLAGARLMAAGRFYLDGEELVLIGRLFDVETGIVLGAHSVSGGLDRIPEMMHDLCSALSAHLPGGPIPSPEGPVEDAPLASLHLMRGLALFHAARYEMAIGEFVASTESEVLLPSAVLWTAKAYIALGEFGHACLELEKIGGVQWPGPREADYAATLGTCRKKTSAGETELIRALRRGE